MLIVQEWLQKHEGDFTLPRWPPESPDLNTILSIYGTKLKGPFGTWTHNNQFSQQLESAIHQTWSQITFNVESIPTRIAAVLNAIGGSTKY